MSLFLICGPQSKRCVDKIESAAPPTFPNAGKVRRNMTGKGAQLNNPSTGLPLSDTVKGRFDGE